MATLSTSTIAIVASAPAPANAKYVLNDDGDYDEVQEEDWQTVWKSRLNKANGMSRDEIFAAARGAGNTELKLREGEEESDASKKRRAMSACRDGGLRAKAAAAAAAAAGGGGGGGLDQQSCNKRVMGGEFDFILSNLN